MVVSGLARKRGSDKIFRGIAKETALSDTL